MGAENQIHIKGIIFDYGNVLSLPQQTEAIAKMASVCGLPGPRFEDLYWRLRPDYDLGEINGPSYWNLFARQAGISLTDEQITQLIQFDCESWALPNEHTVRWVMHLHGQGIRLALLSNMPIEISSYLEKAFAPLQLFDDRVYSYQARRVKPDPEIYRECLTRMTLEPSDVLFFDDRRENVEAASSLGIHSILFDTIENAAARARGFNIPVPV